MKLHQELTRVIAALEKKTGRRFPPWVIEPDPFVLRVQQTDEDEEETPLDWLAELYDETPPAARAALIAENARDLLHPIEAPPGVVHFVPDSFEHVSLLPRDLRKDLGRIVSVKVAPGVCLDVDVGEDNVRWLEQRAGLADAASKSDEAVVGAVAAWMRARVEVESTGRGSFSVTGDFPEVALLDFDAMHLPRVKGAPVAVRLGGITLSFAGDDDLVVLERLVNAALQTLRGGGGPLVGDGRLLRRGKDGQWASWLPPREAATARGAAIELLRLGLEQQYDHHARLLAHRLPDMTFAPVHRLPGGLTTARWVEGERVLLPLTDAYTLVPTKGDAMLLAGSAMLELVKLGCLSGMAYNDEELLSPMRLVAERFPTTAERKKVQPARFVPDALTCWYGE